VDSLVGDNLVVFYYLRESEFWNGKGWALVGGANKVRIMIRRTAVLRGAVVVMIVW
jgi:hypothetical protein